MIRLRQRLLAAPATSVNLIESDCVWSAARKGLNLREAWRAHAPGPQVLHTRQAIRVRELQADSRFEHLLSSAARQGIVSYAVVPLMVEGHVLGTACAFDTPPRGWSDEALAHLQDTAQAASELVHAGLVAQRTRHTEERVRTASLAGSD